MHKGLVCVHGKLFEMPNYCGAVAIADPRNDHIYVYTLITWLEIRWCDNVGGQCTSVGTTSCLVNGCSRMVSVEHLFA